MHQVVLVRRPLLGRGPGGVLARRGVGLLRLSARLGVGGDRLGGFDLDAEAGASRCGGGGVGRRHWLGVGLVVSG